MDRDMVRRHLAQAERHVTEGESHIADQKVLITQLQRGGHDTTQAKELLAIFEDLQVTHITHRNGIRKELEELDR